MNHYPVPVYTLVRQLDGTLLQGASVGAAKVQEDRSIRLTIGGVTYFIPPHALAASEKILSLRYELDRFAHDFRARAKRALRKVETARQYAARERKALDARRREAKS